MLLSSEISKAIFGMAKTFYKTLKVNLTANSYQIVKTNDRELNDKEIQLDSFSSWIESFANSGNVHENDRNVFKNRLSIGSLTQHLKNEDSFRIQYRRKVKDSYRWVSLEIIKTDSFSEDNQVVWLFVRDIHSNYVHEMEIQRELEHYCKFDTLTGLNNYYSYQLLCKNYAAIEEKTSIGLIFADLNGLKLINDTRGHGAGNEFLQTFARKLLEHFSSEHIYRISGDEFLIVIPNCKESEFTFSAKKFETFLNQETVPQASLGYCWMAHPVHIEDVSREAEIHMYQSKEAFYGKHPEYKRGIAELNYKREMDAILKTLANSYDAIITIDLIRDTFWILKQGAGVTFGKNAETYTKMTENFMIAVDDEYKEMVTTVNSIDNLRNDLRKKSSVTIEFKMVDGRWVRTMFKAIETLNGEPTKILLITEHLDHDRVLELEKTKDLMLEHQIIEGLSKGFTLICQIDVPTKNILVYKNIALKDSIPTAIRNLSYDAVVTWFTNKFVVEEDRERTANALRLEAVTTKLENRDVTTVLFRTTPEFHDTVSVSYSMFYFYKLASNPNKLVLATKNVTNSMG
ncbi:MAG: GGDEF domain-containing protein [Fibrobacter sp.]|nr:GGDEF domain-containing protein [Fibrobacter sp.]